jgi:putative restriction endonuclease
MITDVPLSVTTTPPGRGGERPYDDHVGPDGLLRYHYRYNQPGDEDHRDNVGLRMALREQIPLVYFHGLVPGEYLASWPVYIVSDDPSTRTFTVAVDDPAALNPELPSAIVDDARRQYHTRLVRSRLHQAAFRVRVLKAYRECCAVCRLRHRELLDAAHIVPDVEESGEPVVVNGLSLCKLHHAAFDANIMGVRPDYILEVRAAVLQEHDGPMLRHGLQGIHGEALTLPHRTED